MPTQTNNRNNVIAGTLAVIVIAAIGFFIYTRRTPVPAESATASSTTITDAQNSVTVSGGDATVTETSAAPAPVAPNYKAPLTFSASTDAAVKAALQKQFDMTVAALDKDTLDFQAWVNLGTIRKMTGDYKGAETVWLYVSKIYPKSTVAFDNLGVLYLDFLKDYAKAEAMFKQSIAIEKTDINAYQQLFSLYTVYGYKQGTSAAADLIAQGLKANPNNQTLLELQAQLKTQ